MFFFFFFIDEAKKEAMMVSSDYKREYFNEYWDILSYENILIMGIRQIGKTTISDQLTKKYIKENNLAEDEWIKIDIRTLQNYDEKIETIFLNIKDKQYKLVSIDEIQLLKNWSTLLQPLIDSRQLKDTRFIITCSNTISLSSNTLVGRAKQMVMNPLSFNEFKTMWDNDSLEDYINFGSFPKRMSNAVLSRQNMFLTEQIIKDVINEDIEKKINLDKFWNLSSNIINYIGSQIKMSSIYNDLKIEHRTGKECIDILVKSRIIRVLHKYMDKNLNSTYAKVYFNDSGAYQFFNKYKKLNANQEGALIENIVYNHLDTIYNKKFQDTEIYYFRDNKDKECDFIIPSKELLIECKYSDDINELEDAIKQLMSFKNFNDHKKIIVTKTTGMKNKDIELIPLKIFLETFKG